MFVCDGMICNATYFCKFASATWLVLLVLPYSPLFVVYNFLVGNYHTCSPCCSFCRIDDNLFGCVIMVSWSPPIPSLCFSQLSCGRMSQLALMLIILVGSMSFFRFCHNGIVVTLPLFLSSVCCLQFPCGRLPQLALMLIILVGSMSFFRLCHNGFLVSFPIPFSAFCCVLLSCGRMPQLAFMLFILVGSMHFIRLCHNGLLVFPPLLCVFFAACIWKTCALVMILPQACLTHIKLAIVC